MLARSRAPLSVLLAVTLSLSPALSWYAYADQSTEVQEVATDGPRGDEDDRGIGTSDEPGEVGAQSEDDDEVGKGAAEEQAEAPSSPEDSFDIGVASGGSPVVDLDGSSENPYSFSGGNSESSVSEFLVSSEDAFSSDLISPTNYDNGVMPLALSDNAYLGLLSDRSIYSGQLANGSTGTWSHSQLQAYSFNQLVHIFNRLLVVSDSINSFSSLSKKQWGYGYGGTTVIEKDSPAYWLKWLYTYSFYHGTLESGDTGYWSSPQLLSYIFNYTRANNVKFNQLLPLLQKQWGYGYGGTVVLESNSPAAWLQDLSKSARYNGTLETGTSGNYGVAQLAAYTFNYLVATYHRLNDLQQQLKYSGELGDGSTGTWNAGQLLAYISNWTRASWDRLGIIEKQLKYSGELGDGASGTWNAAQLLAYINNWTRASWDRLGVVGDRLTVNGNLVSKGFFDVLSGLDVLHADMSQGVQVDNSGLEQRLDYISDLLKAAGVIENAKDLVSALVGDLDFSVLSSLSSEVASAVSNAFPFCIPAVLKQVLGLVRHDAAAPVWDFEIGGEPMRVDLAPMRPVADVSGWFCRVLFVVVLFANTRRFIFMGGGAASE